MELLRIFTGAPVWVWPLLLGLVWVGYRGSKNRTTSVIGFYLIPFFALLTLNGMTQMAIPDVAWPVFGAAYLAGAGFGYWFQGTRIISKHSGQVVLRGDWLLMVAVMVLFWMGFVRGFISARMPDLELTMGYVAAASAISGSVSGQFAGRAIRVILWPGSAVSGQPKPD